MTTTEIKPDMSDRSRCISIHWSLPVQCVLPCTHRENWHEAWDPETGNRLRYRRTFGTYATEELRNDEWTALFISPPSDMVEVDRAELERLREDNAWLDRHYRQAQEADEAMHEKLSTALGLDEGLSWDALVDKVRRMHDENARLCAELGGPPTDDERTSQGGV